MRPIIIYDDDCDFCTEIAEDMSKKGNYTLLSFSELDSEHKEILPPNYKDCAHIIDNGVVYSCGDVLKHYATRNYSLGNIVRKPGISNIIDFGYNTVARNRSKFGKLYDIIK